MLGICYVLFLLKILIKSLYTKQYTIFEIYLKLYKEVA